MCDTESCDRCKELETVVEELANFVWERLVKTNCDDCVDEHCDHDKDFVTECSMQSCHYRKFNISQHLLY